jgi:hypothetical protein
MTPFRCQSTRDTITRADRSRTLISQPSARGTRREYSSNFFWDETGLFTQSDLICFVFSMPARRRAARLAVALELFRCRDRNEKVRTNDYGVVATTMRVPSGGLFFEQGARTLATKPTACDSQPLFKAATLSRFLACSLLSILAGQPSSPSLSSSSSSSSKSPFFARAILAFNSPGWLDRMTTVSSSQISFFQRLKRASSSNCMPNLRPV